MSTLDAEMEKELADAVSLWYSLLLRSAYKYYIFIMDS